MLRSPSPIKHHLQRQTKVTFQKSNIWKTIGSANFEFLQRRIEIFQTSRRSTDIDSSEAFKDSIEQFKVKKMIQSHGRR